MATALDLFPARVAFVDPRTGQLTAPAVRAMQALFERVGGADGPSSSDLATADDDDSGIEELKAETAKALQALALLQAEASALREMLFEISKSIQGLQQGVTYESS